MLALPWRNKPLLSANYIADIRQRSTFTPDMENLRAYDSLFVFVADETMTNHSQHGLLAAGKRLAIGFTVDDFVMYKHNLGSYSYPIVMRGQQNSYHKPAKIKGELYQVTPEMFFALDTHRANGLQFRRKRVKIKIPYADKSRVWDERIKELTVWMYVGKSSYWDHHISQYSGYKPVQRYQHRDNWIDTYYYYSLKEANDF